MRQRAIMMFSKLRIWDTAHNNGVLIYLLLAERDIELVADRAARTPLAPWPDTPPRLAALIRDGLAQGVSFASRGNLLLLAPPLVIEERDLADALSLLDRLLAVHFAN